MIKPVWAKHGDVVEIHWRDQHGNISIQVVTAPVPAKEKA